MRSGMFPSVPPLPRRLQVEVTSACNLRCATCLVRYRPPVNKLAGALDEGLFRRLVDDLSELEDLTLQGLGEPILARSGRDTGPGRLGRPRDEAPRSRRVRAFIAAGASGLSRRPDGG